MTGGSALLDQFGNVAVREGDTPLPAAKPDALFVYDRQAPTEWDRMLKAVVPQYEGLGGFLIRWEPGEEWDPIQRWIIWQTMTPADTQKLILADNPLVMGLVDEHPRAGAKWNEARGCYVKPDGRTAKTDKLTWEIYHETGCKASRFWVVQGETGGHRYNLSGIERKLLKLGSRGKLKDVPNPGDLPYADFDSRVLPHFEKIEAAARARKVYKYAAQRQQALDADEVIEAEKARLMLFEYLGEQFGAQYDAFRPQVKQALREIRDHLPVGFKPTFIDGDKAKDEYVKDR